MAKKFTKTDPYSADVDQLWAMLSDRDYHQAKYESLGADNITFRSFSADDTSITMVNERDVPADLPGFAKKIIGETNHVTQTERWTRAGDSVTCAVQITVKNLPGGTTGTIDITPVESGCTWSTDFDIKIGVPLVGGKLEDLMKDETTSNQAQEKVFNDQWLADNA